MGPNILKRWLKNESKPIIFFLISQNTLADLKGLEENIICTMDDVRGDFFGPPHGSAPAAVIGHKIKLRSFKSSEQL